VDTLVTIGEFSRMTYLTVKALRHYHDVGLLEPIDVDPSSGYRRYSTDQVAAAQAIRRFRDLDMPIDQIRAVLEASDGATRNQAILQHLEYMQQQLERTQLTVASLQALLEHAPTTASIEYRSITPTRSLAIRDTVRFDAADAWCTEVFAELHDAIKRARGAASGPDGALYFNDFFERGEGEVIAFVPVDGDAMQSGRAERYEIAATNVAVMIHDGPFGDLDQTYGALGTIVAERNVGAAGPIREHYVDDERTEVCWPVTVSQT
jgi:DNA-binding transcriptional MerR regulator